MYSNPYSWNRVNLDVFFGRWQLVSDMCRRLAKKTDSFAVIGGRRMGKTMVLRKTEQALDEQRERSPDKGYVILPVYVDFQTCPIVDNLSLAWGEVVDRIAIRCNSIPGLDVGKLHASGAALKRGDVVNPFETVSSALASILCSTAPASLVLVVMLDEAEKLLLYEWCDDFWRNWRALIHNTPGVSSSLALVLSGSVELCEIAKDKTSSLFGVLEPKFLEVFSSEDSVSLMTEPGAMPISQPTCSAILEWTGGHPFMMQYILSHIYENQDMTQEDALSDAKRSFIQGQEFILRTWWSQMGSCGQAIYRFLASANGPVPKAQLISKWAVDDVNWALDVICSCGIGYRSGRTEVAATGSVFREWAKDSGLLDVPEAVETVPNAPETAGIPPAKYQGREWCRRQNVDQKLKIVELELRSAIRQVYEAEYYLGWQDRVEFCLEKLNGGRDMVEVTERARRAPDKYESDSWAPPTELLHYTSLGHLECLISSDWDKFNFIFGSGKDARRRFSENFAVVAKMRNELSHPLPTECSIPATELMRAEVACDDILSRLKRSLSVP